MRIERNNFGWTPFKPVKKNSQHSIQAWLKMNEFTIEKKRMYFIFPKNLYQVANQTFDYSISNQISVLWKSSSIKYDWFHFNVCVYVDVNVSFIQNCQQPTKMLSSKIGSNNKKNDKSYKNIKNNNNNK